MNICLVELKMKDSFKTGCFASKWLIEIEAKWTNWAGKSSLLVDIETKLKYRKECVFRWLCVICWSTFDGLDFNQSDFCRQRLCMGDLLFEQGESACCIYKFG